MRTLILLPLFACLPQLHAAAFNPDRHLGTERMLDSACIPANTVHQFLTEPGQSFTAMVVKITPKA